MRKKLQSMGVALVLSLAPTTNDLYAQWISNGPYGGAMYAIETEGTNVYAGTGANGVFKSTDNGQTWTAANAGLERKWINAITTTSTHVFAGTYYEGVY